MENRHVLLGMSGGVDSSASILLLQKDGWQVHGCTLHLCSSADSAVKDARAVAEKLQIPFTVRYGHESFEEWVLQPFVDAYCSGRTPNPCVACNPNVKFRQLIAAADEAGCSHVATGHYARVEFSEETGRYAIKKACYREKDQSYMLVGLSQAQLSRIIFPLGAIDSKAHVRTIAEEAGLQIAQKKDSQDICFLPDGNYAKFLQDFGHIDLIPGNFVDENGKVLGRHKGLPCYTTGQRKGLGVGGSDYPLYVIRKNSADNTVVLGPESHLYSTRLEIDRPNWMMIETLQEPLRCTAKTRYSQFEAEATVSPLADGRAEVVFDEPQRAVTCGQAAVLYAGDTVLGGGTISKTDF